MRGGKKKIRQFENREKMLRQKLFKEERRTRSHRLIVRGAVFESIVPEAKGMTNEESATFLLLLCHVYFSFFQALNTDFYFCFHSIVYGGCLLSFWNIDDFVTGVKFFSPAVSHFISDIFTIPIQLTIIKNVRLPAKARNHIHLHQGDMTEK